MSHHRPPRAEVAIAIVVIVILVVLDRGRPVPPALLVTAAVASAEAVRRLATGRPVRRRH